MKHIVVVACPRQLAFGNDNPLDGTGITRAGELSNLMMGALDDGGKVVFLSGFDRASMQAGSLIRDKMMDRRYGRSHLLQEIVQDDRLNLSRGQLHINRASLFELLKTWLEIKGADILVFVVPRLHATSYAQAVTSLICGFNQKKELPCLKPGQAWHIDIRKLTLAMIK